MMLARRLIASTMLTTTTKTKNHGCQGILPVGPGIVAAPEVRAVVRTDATTVVVTGPPNPISAGSTVHVAPAGAPMQLRKYVSVTPSATSVI